MSVKNSISKLTNKLIKGDISLDKFHSEFSKLLTDAHTKSSLLGASKALFDSDIKLDEDLKLIISKNLDSELTYLNNFIDRIKNGEYTDKKDKLSTNALLYYKNVRITGNESWLHFITKSEEMRWFTTAFESCTECPWMEKTSKEVPFTKDTLFVLPGMLECEMNCKCYIETLSGLRSLEYVD